MRVGGDPRPGAPLKRLLAALTAVAGAVAAAAFATAVATRPPLPLARVAAARQTLDRVERALPHSADGDLATAHRLSAAMELEMARARGALLRRGAAERAVALAGDAEARALRALWRHDAAERGSLAGARDRLVVLERRLAGYAESLPAFPADHRLRRHFLRSRLELEQARDALADRDVAGAEAGMADARFHLDALAGEVEVHTARLDDPVLRRRWQEWVDHTIADTKGGGEAVIVEKASGMCYLVRGGRVAAGYRAELGRGGFAGKLHAGDAATPEGRYRVVQKRDLRATKFHRALLLDYPNQDDVRAYEAAIRRGQIPRGRGIGSLIEIHGEGGRGLNWTDGCIALTNADMDRLFAAVSSGTPVTIVGRARIPGADRDGPPRLSR